MSLESRGIEGGRGLSIVANVLEHGLIAVIDAPIAERIVEWGIAVSRGGIKLLGIPVTLPNVTEVVSELDDEGDLIVGISGVTDPAQVAVAVAAGAELVITPVTDPEVIEAAKSRGLTVIAGALTPNEVQIARRAGADLISIHPVGAMGLGERYFANLRRTFPDLLLLVSGDIDVENAPAFLELGASAAVVDRSVFPADNDPAAAQIITMRAAALTEVCADALGTPSRVSFTDLSEAIESTLSEAPAAPSSSPRPPPPPPPPVSASGLESESGIAGIFDEDELPADDEGSQPLIAESTLEGALAQSASLNLDD